MISSHNVGTDSKGELQKVEDWRGGPICWDDVPHVKPIGNTIFIPLLSNYLDIHFHLVWITAKPLEKAISNTVFKVLFCTGSWIFTSRI
jgi:hypothetical protein